MSENISDRSAAARLRVAFFGSPPFATPILARVLAGPHELVALVTRPDRPRGRGRRVEPSPLAELARARGVAVLAPERARDRGFQAELAALAPDLLLVASYGQILDEPLLALAPRGAFNVHASLLPRHRGASPIQAALRAGDAQSGVTIQRMVLALDEGDVLLARELAIRPDETAGELTARLAELGAQAAAEALERVARGDDACTPQDPARATYAPRIRKEEGWIDWSRPAAEIERHVRAMTPWPGARARLADGRELAIGRARERATPAERAEPGTLVEAGPRLVVATGEGSLELLELTPAGRRSLPAEEYLRGARLAAGMRFAGAP